MKQAGSPYTIDQWKDLTKDDYLYFVSGMQSGELVMLTRPPPAAKTVDLVAEFKKGIKRDASLYPVLKDNRPWNNWQ